MIGNDQTASERGFEMKMKTETYIEHRIVGSGVQAANCAIYLREWEDGEIEEVAECPGKYNWVSSGSKFKRVRLVQPSLLWGIERKRPVTYRVISLNGFDFYWTEGKKEERKVYLWEFQNQIFVYDENYIEKISREDRGAGFFRNTKDLSVGETSAGNKDFANITRLN